VLALDGQFSAGPCPGMAFHVTAALPYQAAGLALEPRP